ncbi:MAG: phosphohydrolase [Flavobacterium sp. BFFFF2]|nr:MAG: phosphohydrolase [Flavobacterium sp. BFFFF2]
MNTNKLKIFNDPIYGFISIPNPLIFDLIQHPYFQRLRRISQMGLSYLVYPGAHHTRFHHALGAMHLMQKAVDTLRSKNVPISKEEENGLYVAILLHDIGHGPFSHALELSIVEKIHHEDLSLLFMEALNDQFDGQLSVGIAIFKGGYHRQCLGQLVSGQLDMDRLDYLKRDSFYTGVAEGNINSERLIQMLNIVNDELVLEEKSIYSIEKFLMARRLMYWQAYLHKTSLVAEMMLANVLRRAKELLHRGKEVPLNEPLRYFMELQADGPKDNKELIRQFAKLDDFDVIHALKSWMDHPDFILQKLSQMILERDLLKVTLNTDKFDPDQVHLLQKKVQEFYGLTQAEAAYFVFKGKIKNQAYNKEGKPIRILRKDGSLEDIVDLSDQMNLRALSKPVTKYFLCFPKNL